MRHDDLQVGGIANRKKRRNAFGEGQGCQDVFRAIFESSNQGIAVLKRGRLLLVNPRFSDIWGYYDRDEMLVLGEYDFVEQPDRDRIRGIEEGLFRGETVPPSFQFWGARKDGTSVSVEAIATMCGFDGGQSLLLYVQQAAEDDKRLSKSESLFRYISEQSTVGIYILQDGILRFVNDSFARMHGYEVHEMINRPAVSLTSVDQARSAMTNRSERVTEVDAPRQVTIVARNGLRRDVLAFTVAAPYQGKPAIIGSLVDISNFAAIARALDESEERYRVLFEQSPVGLMETDESERKAYLNDLRNQGVTDFQRYFDEHPEEVHRCAALITIKGVNKAYLRSHGEDFTAVQLVDRLTLRAGNEPLFPVVKETLVAMAEGRLTSEKREIHDHKNGSDVYRLLQSRVLPGHEESFGRVITSSVDITELRRTQQELRNSRAIMQAVMDTLPVAVCLSDHQGNIEYVNRQFTRLFGYAADEIPTVKEWLVAAYPDPAYRESVASCASPAPSESHPSPSAQSEVVMTSKDGSEIMVLRLRAFTENRVVVVYMDVTQRKKAEEEVRTGRAQLSEAMEIARMASYEYDPATREFVLNDPFYALFATSADREGGYRMAYDEYVKRFVHPEEVSRFYERKDLTHKNGRIRDFAYFEHKAVRRDGEVIYLLNRVRFTEGSDGRLYATRGVNQDITERRKAETALRQIQGYLSEAVDMARIAYYEFDPTALEYVFNDPFYALLGTNAGREGGYRMSQREYVQRFVHLEDRWMFERRDGEDRWVGGADGMTSIEHRAIRRDGEIIHLLNRTKIVKDGKGSVIRVYGVNQDITEQKRIEEEVAKKAEELARSNADLERFAYVASHDLQEPLRMVASFTELLGRRYKGRLDADADDFIGYAVDGANRMKRLIDDLLTYSRVGSRGNPLKPTDMNVALKQALANLVMMIEDSGAKVECDDLPVVTADESQMAQLFQNLVANGLKFRGAEAPVIHVSAVQTDTEWVFSIADNGIGIEHQHLTKIFAIFQRLHTRDQYPGTGIGLAVCKRIVERHHGRIWVESEPGEGSTFHFTLPKGGKP